MRMTRRASPLFFPHCFVLNLILIHYSSLASNQSYIVYLGEHSHGVEPSEGDLQRARDSHYELLGSFLGSKERARDAIFYSYTKHINGFAANLEDEEAAEIAKHSNVVSVFPNKGRELHTTHSWAFLGLEKPGKVPMKSLWRKARFGENIIIGSIDTGVWPESRSFNDVGLGPVPSKWRGICQNSTLDRIQCNRKLIGVRYFKKGYEAKKLKLDPTLTTARDFSGHGTHTLATAAGRFIHGANVFGHGNGTAKGGAPNARVAAYKVCWDLLGGKSCYDADLIAAFDAAIDDGVDVISASLGGDSEKYFYDAIAIGAFHAMKRGIPVVSSSGNTGKVGSVVNTAPWLVTVAASTTDREFISSVVLGDNRRLKVLLLNTYISDYDFCYRTFLHIYATLHICFQGRSLSMVTLPDEKFYPLISSGDAKASGATELDAQFCSTGALNPQKVEGKIVVCQSGFGERLQKGVAVLLAGGVGMILVNDRSTRDNTTEEPHILPATHVSASHGATIFDYINSTESPTAYITPVKTQLNSKPAPVMAPFSSQGPNPVVPKILKPDITAPGVNIIAAFAQATSAMSFPSDSRKVEFVMVSGTSMSSPHIAAVAGLLKAVHPEWSPAAIKSAIMTTASVQDNTRKPIISSSLKKANPFGFGSGHVRPNRAVDPGLVYDLKAEDYLSFLCSLGYTPPERKEITSTFYTCPDKSLDLLNFNYPAITVPDLFGSANVTRILKNVGPPGTYRVRIQQPDGMSVSVKPKSLTFEEFGDEKVFRVLLKAKNGGVGGEDYVFGRINWTDGVHNVRSPIVVKVRRN